MTPHVSQNLRRDAGHTLIELIVAMSLLGALVAGGIKLYHDTTIGRAEEQQRVAIQAGIDDAQGQLTRDVTDGISLRVADAQRLTVTVVRDGLCQQRAYAADTTAHTFSVTTSFYETASCSGTPKVAPPKVLIARYDATSTFVYWGESATVPIPTPVSDTRNVGRIAWDFSAVPYVTRTAPDVTQASSAVWNGLGDDSGTGVARLLGKAPILTVTTPSPANDHPVLTWTDNSPTVTAGWVIVRAAYPEGASETDADSRFRVIQNIPSPTILTWTDFDLAPGYRATYLVYALLTDNFQGPASRNADAGRRPAAPTGVGATGAATSITVSWTRSSGATGYDLFRDGRLAASLGDVSTWTDALSFGHTHTYNVVATNRWESVLTTGSQNLRVPLGDALTKGYVAPDGATVTRLASASAGAFTAPAAPSLTATPNANWTNTVTVTYAPWVGVGPVGARDRGWVTQVATLSGTFTPLWGESGAGSQTQGGRPSGATTRYQATACNTSGCGPIGPIATALQRPPAPTCTIGGVTTRSLVVTVTPAGEEAPYTGYTIAGGTGSPTGLGTQATTGFVIDQLTYGATQTFTATSSNGSPAGASDAASCAGATPMLTVGPATCSRSVTDSTDPGSITIGGGTEVKLGSGGTVYGGPRSFSGLGAGTYYGYARNAASDGWNPTVYSGWDTCGSATINVGIPAAPTSLRSGYPSQGYSNCSSGGSGGGARVLVKAYPAQSSNATGYNGQFEIVDQTYGLTYGPTFLSLISVVPGEGAYLSGSMDYNASSVVVRFQASNGSGSSSWGPWINLPMSAVAQCN